MKKILFFLSFSIIFVSNIYSQQEPIKFEDLMEYCENVDLQLCAIENCTIIQRFVEGNISYPVFKDENGFAFYLYLEGESKIIQVDIGNTK